MHICTRVHVCIHVYTHIYIYVYIHVCGYIHMRVFVYLFLKCMHITRLVYLHSEDPLDAATVVSWAPEIQVSTQLAG